MERVRGRGANYVPLDDVVVVSTRSRTATPFSVNVTFTGCARCVNRYHSRMGLVGVITGRFIERSAGLIATLWVAIIDMILLLDRSADIFLRTGLPADAAVQRLGYMPSGRSCSLESDTVDARHATLSTSHRELVVVGAGRVIREGNPVMRPAGYKPPEPVHDGVRCSDGGYVDADEAWVQGRSLGSTPRKLKR
jgi:hypothetical protein